MVDDNAREMYHAQQGELLHFLCCMEDHIIERLTFVTSHHARVQEYDVCVMRLWPICVLDQRLIVLQ